MPDQPTEFYDLPKQEQLRVKRHLLVALEAVGLGRDFTGQMVDALDDVVEANRHE